MSHEIRTPLNAVLGLARLLGHTPLNPLQAEYLRKLAAAGRSLLSIIDDILTFSKVEAGKLTLTPREFSIDELLEELASIIAATAEEKDLEVVLRLAPDVPRTLVGDVGRIKQVLINLTRNAVKFSERGEIIVDVSREEVLAEGAVRLRFAVKDTGVGIPADQLERIFEPFTQANNSATRSHGGTGLGLPISRKLVCTMSGDLYVQSTPGQGSTFWFSIPLGVAASSAASDSGSVELPASLRVLALCRSPLITRFLSDTCCAFGWDFVVEGDAASAAAALKQADEAHSPFDVVLVNWTLRDSQGLELARGLRALPDSVQPLLIFLIQCHARAALDTALAGLVLDEVIEKPVTASGLYRTVARALLRRGPAPAQSAPVPQPSEPPTAKRLRGLRILVVDDNPIVLEVTTALLNHEGAILTAVSGGRAALERLGDGPPPFDVVLLDIQMPEMDGYQTACEIRRRPGLAKLPVIAVSAGVLWEERNRCRAAGMNGFLSKPMDVEEAVLLIGSLTAQALPATAEPARSDEEPEDKVRFDVSASLGSAGLDAAALASLLVLFLQENAAMQSSTRAGMERGDLEGTAKALHRLRGTAAILGAGRLARACQALELRLRSGEAAGAQAEVQEYEAALREVLEAARAFLRRRA
jgi:hypothetical protein